MPFTTVCPGCDARLNAPDALRGKKVKCKKCGDAFVARPADGTAENDDHSAKTVKMSAKEPPPKRRRDDDDPTEEAPPARGKKSARRPADDDTEVIESARRPRDAAEDDEPRPRAKKKKGKKKSGPPVLLFVLIGVGALLLLGGGGVGAYFAFFAEEENKPDAQAKAGTAAPTPPKTPAVDTSAWIEHHDADGRYRIKFPTAPQSVTQTVPTPAGRTQIKLHVAQMAGSKEMFATLHQAVPAERGGASDEQLLDQMLDMATAQAKGATLQSNKTIRHQDFLGREAVFTAPGKEGTLVLRVILAGDRVIVIMSGGESATATSPRIRAFFESLRIE
jgi:hypothetical protein